MPGNFSINQVTYKKPPPTNRAIDCNKYNSKEMKTIHFENKKLQMGIVKMIGVKIAGMVYFITCIIVY